MKFNTTAEVLFFVSSSGHCTLDCQYCIVEPVAKHQPSLSYEDLRFLIDSFQAPAFFSFSGLGDFFAGYKPSQRLLSRLLDHDVDIALDINGVLIHEFPDLTDEQLEKIRYINLSMHYHQLVQKDLKEQWARHARKLIRRRFNQIHPDYVLSPPLIDEWETALDFYSRHVFSATNKPILLVRNINMDFDAAAEVKIRQLCQQFGEVIAGTHQENFAAMFAQRPQVLCPAGKTYFRIWNDGHVQGCPHIPALAACGDVKQRVLKPRTADFLCNCPHYCDCHVIDALGKMKLPSS
jgi:hypothetical protein